LVRKKPEEGLLRSKHVVVTPYTAVVMIIMIRYDMIYLLTAIGLTPGGSSTVHIYTQTVHRTTQ